SLSLSSFAPFRPRCSVTQLPPALASGSKRRIVVLGSTGSIGTSCLDVISHLADRLVAIGLSAHTGWDTLFAQAKTHQPRWVTITDDETFKGLDKRELPRSVQLLHGLDGIKKMVSDPEVDVVVTAIVGAAGLMGTWTALEAGKTVAIANK